MGNSFKCFVFAKKYKTRCQNKHYITQTFVGNKFKENNTKSRFSIILNVYEKYITKKCRM